MATTTKSELEQVKSDLARLRDDLGDLSAALLNGAREKASEVGDKVARKAERGSDALQDLMETLRDKREQAADGVKEQVSAHPFASLAGMFGAGFLLGKLFDRS